MQRTSLLCVVCCATLLAAPGLCHAQDLLFTLNPAAQSAVQGTTIAFNATLTNLGGNRIYLTDETISLTGTGLSLNKLLTFEFPDYLDPNDSATGDLFEVVVASATAPANYFGSVAMLGGMSLGATDMKGQQNLLLTVTADVLRVPEPGSVALLVGMGVSGAGWLLRCRVRRSLCAGA